MPDYRIPRPSDIPLEVTGVLLADVSTAEPGKTNWAVRRIYRSDDTGRYIVEQVGKTSVPGQHDRIQVDIVDDAAGVVEALHRVTDGRRFITNLNRAVLERAARKDPAIKAAAVQKV